MTWFRKHWPDLLILFFIVLILAGAVLILFGGTKKLFNLSATQPALQAEATTPAVEEIPLNPAPSTEVETPAEENAPQEPQTQTSILGAEGSETAAESSETTPAETQTQQTQQAETVPVIPATGTETPAQTQPATSPAATEETAQTPAEQTPAEGQVDPAGTEQAQPQPTPAPQPAVQAIQGRSPTKQDYRISAGLYATEAQAKTVADKIQGLGYPSFVFPSKDDNFVVLIGPFANRSDADTAVGQIQTVHQNLFVYAPQNPTPSPSATAEAPQTSPPAETATGTSTPVYLQVGAYKRADSAVPALDQLRSLGFNPTLRTDANGMVRIVVGPFGATELPAAQSKLQASGYTDAFQVR